MPQGYARFVPYMAKKRRSNRQSQDSTTAIVAVMAPLVYVMAYAILITVK
ncbi:hypothetical protein FBY36_4035 [Arthrobacter sp. SLBN-122]|nr:hypothetical protein FBY36_4035 [Arthrobacter sp. SLBN-122]